MNFEVGILNDCNPCAVRLLEHAAATYDGKLQEFALYNPITDETEHVQFVDCHMPVVGETRLVSITLSAPKTPCLLPLLLRLKAFVLLIDDGKDIAGLNQVAAILRLPRLNTTPECMVLANPKNFDAVEHAISSISNTVDSAQLRLFAMPAEPSDPKQVLHLIQRFISAQREAEIALLIDRKSARTPRYNEAERIIAAHALKDKIIEAANAIRARRDNEKRLP
jgi:hypothetical protein